MDVTTVLILPLMVALFKKELGNLFSSWQAYRLRRFDLDGNPLTSDEVEIFNIATGGWEYCVIERQVFSLDPKKRGVFLYHSDGGREKVSWHVWSGFRKRNPPDEGGSLMYRQPG